MNENNQSRQSLKNHAYQILKEKLVDCIYPPGSLLNEAQLAKELELSRTPIRESISKLEMEGFIKVIPKKGIYVTDITLSDVVQVFQARVEMEPIALRLAAPHLPLEELKNFSKKFHEPIMDVHNSFRLDTAMHLFIIEYCRNRFIINTMKRVFEENTRIIISSKQNQAKIHDAKEEHLEILNKLIDGKYAEAEQCMVEHIKSCRISALEYFYNNQLYTPVPANDYKKELDKL